MKSNGKIYWYGLSGEPLAESDTSGNFSDEYVFFGGSRVAHRVVSGNSIYYYVQDHLGTSRMMLTSAGTACYDADFTPFGRELVVTNTCAQNYKFTGKERDPETGNDDFGARSYSSNFGRFMSADWSAIPEPVPYANLTNPQTLNLYAMVQDNPTTFADPDGHEIGDGDGDGSGGLNLGGDPNDQDPKKKEQEVQGQVHCLNATCTKSTQTVVVHGDLTVWDRLHWWWLGLAGTMRSRIRGGPPNGREWFPDNKSGGTLRHYDEKGNAQKDVDFGHDHDGAGDPHTHTWNGNERGAPNSIRPGEPIYAPITDTPMAAPGFAPFPEIPLLEPILVP